VVYNYCVTRGYMVSVFPHTQLVLAFPVGYVSRMKPPGTEACLVEVPTHSGFKHNQVYHPTPLQSYLIFVQSHNLDSHDELRHLAHFRMISRCHFPSYSDAFIMTF